MKNLFLYLLTLEIFLSSCTNLRVITDINSQADFTEYGSYAFVESTSLADDPFYKQLDLVKVKEAVRLEMNTRGYLESHYPDVWIDVSFFVEEKIQLVPDPWFYQDGGYKELDNYDFSIYQYREENLIIDLIDASNDQLVWKGMAFRILTTYDTQSTEERIIEAVNAVFNGYPYEREVMNPISLGQRLNLWIFLPQE